MTENREARNHDEWRLEYMTLMMRDQENIEKGRAETLVKCVDALMENLKLSLEDACKALNTTVKAYESAKDFINQR